MANKKNRRDIKTNLDNATPGQRERLIKTLWKPIKHCIEALSNGILGN